MSFFAFAKTFSRRRHDKRFDPWYTDLKMDQLKQLCKAAKVPISGRKDELVARLSTDSIGQLFTYEKSNNNPTGLTNADLKALCETRGITKSGGRFDLVCRLLQYEHRDVNKEASTDDNNVSVENNNNNNNNKKRPPLGDAAATTNDDGNASIRHKKPRLCHYQVLYNRIQRKIHSGSTNKRYDSHMGSKAHSGDVYELISKTLTEEILDENYQTKNPKKALELAKAIFTSLAEHFQSIIMPGYDMWSHLDDSLDNLQNIVECAVGATCLSHDETLGTLQWVKKLQAILGPYDFGSDALNEIIRLLIAKVDNDDKAEAANDGECEDTLTVEEGSRKPAAQVVSSAKSKDQDGDTRLPAAKENHVPNIAVHASGTRIWL